MKLYAWNSEKNEELKALRGVSFEQVVFQIANGALLDIVDHPHPERYRKQRIFIVRINDYAYLVPFVENNRQIFLKTIIPSRKATKQYLEGEQRNA